MTLVWQAVGTGLKLSHGLLGGLQQFRKDAQALQLMAEELHAWWKVFGSPVPSSVARFLEATFPDWDTPLMGKAGTFSDELLDDVNRLGGVDGSATPSSVQKALGYDEMICLALGLTVRKHRRQGLPDRMESPQPSLLETAVAMSYGAYAGFIVGSPDSNRAAAPYLEDAQRLTGRQFRFGREEGWPFHSPTGAVYGPAKDPEKAQKAKMAPKDKQAEEHLKAYVSDYGLLARMPNRKKPHLKTVLVMGPTRFGTAAAALPFTRPELARDGKDLLAELHDTHQDKDFFAVIGVTLKDGLPQETWLEESIPFDHYAP